MRWSHTVTWNSSALFTETYIALLILIYRICRTPCHHMITSIIYGVVYTPHAVPLYAPQDS